jgi:micrococcal nuclease
VKQEGKRAGNEQADPERAAQPSKVNKNKETQPPRVVKKKQPRAAVVRKPHNTANEDMGRGTSGPTVRVIQAVDGDTIDVTPRVDGREQIRLIGVDTPEVGQPYAQEASAFTRKRLEGLWVALEFDVERIDPYDRLLAYVYLPDGTMFNAALLRAGYAQVATFPPNVKHTERLLAAQRQARAARRGLWGLPKEERCELTNRGNGIGEGSAGCTARAPSPPPPSSKGAVPPISQTACPNNAPIKGNTQSGIYHTRASATYDETYPEECFASEAAARAAGYRAARD